jgi:hypothetical protein
MARQKIAVKRERSVQQRIGPYEVTYHPALTFYAPPKVEIGLPGTDYTVIITLSEGDNGIVVVDPRGMATNIPVYEDQHDLMRRAALTRDGWALATIFSPVIAMDEPAPPHHRRPARQDCQNDRQRLDERCARPPAAENRDTRVIIGGNSRSKDAGMILPNGPGLPRGFQNSAS